MRYLMPSNPLPRPRKHQSRVELKSSLHLFLLLLLRSVLCVGGPLGLCLSLRIDGLLKAPLMTPIDSYHDFTTTIVLSDETRLLM